MTDTLEAAPSRLDLQRSITTRNSDPTLPFYPIDEQDRRAFPITDPGIQAELDDACRATSWAASPGELPIWEQFARLASLTGLPPLSTDPNTAAFSWARARCVLAGAGYEAHKPIATILTALYPVCDLDPGEDLPTWTQALAQAHTNCGWPVTLGRIAWRRLVTALPLVARDDPPELWHIVVALLHLLKHARTRPNGIVITYRGTAALIRPESGNVPGHWTKQQTSILRALGCTVGVPAAQEHPLTKAMKLILGRITLDKLLAQTPLGDLPMSVMAGPWSSVEPDPGSRDAFIQAECRLAGVWAASGGKVAPYTGDPIDAVAYQWNVVNPGDFGHAKDALIASMPQSYPQSWPADLLLTAFPNIMLDWATDRDAAKVLLELPFVASVLRRTNGPFGNEYPLVAFLPDVPTPDDSTNQGKSRLATVYVRTMAPGTPCIVAQDTGSAPDSRALADVLLTHGTIALDEWAMPATKTNVLNHQNLQTLCTGGSVAAGRVLENSGALTLKHSLVASSKALDFPPDMVNRSFLWTLRTFTPQELARAQVKRDAESGALSLQLRLATLSTVETFGVEARFAAAPYAAGLLRFDAHMVLAKLLYELRTGRPETGQIDQTLREMRARYYRHTQDADASGVLAGLEQGGVVKVRLSNVFAGMTVDALEQVRVELDSLHGRAKVGNWNTPAQLLDVLRRVRGFPSLQSMMPSITGSRGRATDRVIVMALGSDIRQAIGEGSMWHIPDAPYAIERGADQSGFLRVRIIPIGSGAAAASAGPGVAPPVVSPV